MSPVKAMTRAFYDFLDTKGVGYVGAYQREPGPNRTTVLDGDFDLEAAMCAALRALQENLTHGMIEAADRAMACRVVEGQARFRVFRDGFVAALRATEDEPSNEGETA